MDEKKIEKAFADAKIEREITCEQAWAIAEKHGFPKSDIAAYCNKNRVKIRHCQLGCF